MVIADFDCGFIDMLFKMSLNDKRLLKKGFNLSSVHVSFDYLSSQCKALTWCKMYNGHGCHSPHPS